MANEANICNFFVNIFGSKFISQWIWICQSTTRNHGPSHCAFHSFSNGLDQFHYSDILSNLVELASEQVCVAMTNGILVD
jgi:hypothetical protein